MLVLAMLFAAVVLAALPPIPVPGLFREHPGGSLGLIVLERLDAAGPWTIPALLVSAVASLVLFLGALGAPVLDSAREAALLQARRSWGEAAGMDPEVTEGVFQAILRASRQTQGERR